VNHTTLETNFFYDVSSKFTVRSGYRYVTGDAEVPASSLSQISVFESGGLRRNIALAGANYRPMKNLAINLEYEGGISDQIYFRNSLNNYSRGRVRARYQESNSLSFQLNFQILDNQNPARDIRFDFLSLHATAGAYWTPNNAKRVTVSAEYDRAWINSDILYVNLPFFTPAISSYTENAHTGTAAVDVALPKWSGAKLTAGGSFVLLTGSRPTTYYQPLARVSIPVHKHVYWNAEWRYYGFSETFFLYEGFRTNIFTTGLRVTR
jgi:opacity protein-like surface antigen